MRLLMTRVHAEEYIPVLARLHALQCCSYSPSWLDDVELCDYDAPDVRFLELVLLQWSLLYPMVVCVDGALVEVFANGAGASDLSSLAKGGKASSCYGVQSEEKRRENSFKRLTQSVNGSASNCRDT